MLSDVLYAFLHRGLSACSAIIASPNRNEYKRWRHGENIAQTPVAVSAGVQQLPVGRLIRRCPVEYFRLFSGYRSV